MTMPLLLSLFTIACLSLSLPYCLAYSSVKANSWQKRLDRALVDVDGSRSAQGRVRSIQRALQDPKFQKDVSKAVRVVRKKGFGKGHPQFIELLWPRGTVARSDIEGLQALVTKQLPERWEEVQKYDGETISAFFRAPSSSSSSSSSLSSSALVAPQPNTVLNELFGRVRDEPDRALKLAQNALRSSPMEVESPTYETIQTIAPEEKQEASLETIPIVEVRRYEAYQAVSCTLQSKAFSLENMGAGLNRLFSYLVLGDNVENMIMEMTTPFVMETNDDDTITTTMTVKLPSAHSEIPPLPSSDAVSVTEVPGVVLATLPFLGICTDPEIERQTESLLEILEEEGKWEVVSGATARVLQYNAPGTLPWRRKNEVGIAVVEKEETEKSTEDDDEVVLLTNTTAVDEETSTEPVDVEAVTKEEEEGSVDSTTE